MHFQKQRLSINIFFSIIIVFCTHMVWRIFFYADYNFRDDTAYDFPLIWSADLLLVSANSHSKVVFFLHVAAGMVALLSSCLQILALVRDTSIRRFHAAIGKTYALSVLIASNPLCVTKTGPGFFQARSSDFLLGVCIYFGIKNFS